MLAFGLMLFVDTSPTFAANTKDQTEFVVDYYDSVLTAVQMDAVYFNDSTAVTFIDYVATASYSGDFYDVPDVITYTYLSTANRKASAGTILTNHVKYDASVNIDTGTYSLVQTKDILKPDTITITQPPVKLE